MESQRGNPVWFLALTMGFVFGAIACGGGSNKSPTARLDAPTGLSATTTGAGELRLDWNVVAGATSYDLYMSTSPGVTKATGSLIAGVFPPHPLSGLANGTTYYFVATAIDTAGGTPESLASTEALGVPDTLGILHTTFGSGGVAVHDNAAGGGGLDIGVDIALDSSGRILVVGTADNGIDLDMVIWRYTSAGALDTTFNGQGWVVHDNAAGGVGNDYGRAIALDFSGRILVAGNGDGDPTAGTDLDMVIWRYSSGGTLDTTFDGRGWVVHDNAAGGGGYD
ncbi:MAG: delta-60 repeat domain-containing protein [Planctomycetota bacterium]|nr:delta-60 repeat domain-containing protein [Planctomycetota bacterium]